MKTKIALLLLSTLALAGAAPVSLTDTEGRTIEVVIRRVGPDSVDVTLGDKPFTIQLKDLDEASRKTVATTPAEPLVQEVRTRLRAQTVSSSRTADEKWTTSWGSYDRDVYRSRSVEATVECTMGDETAALQIQWIGSQVGRASSRSIVSLEVVAVKLKPGMRSVVGFDALFVENDANYAALGMRDQDGIKYVGWIVRLFGEDDRLLVEQASNPSYLTRFPVDGKKR